MSEYIGAFVLCERKRINILVVVDVGDKEDKLKEESIFFLIILIFLRKYY
jgi:hypothetical protein